MLSGLHRTTGMQMREIIRSRRPARRCSGSRWRATLRSLLIAFGCCSLTRQSPGVVDELPDYYPSVRAHPLHSQPQPDDHSRIMPIGAISTKQSLDEPLITTHLGPPGTRNGTICVGTWGIPRG